MLVSCWCRSFLTREVSDSIVDRAGRHRRHHLQPGGGGGAAARQHRAAHTQVRRGSTGKVHANGMQSSEDRPARSWRICGKGRRIGPSKGIASFRFCHTAFCDGIVHDLTRRTCIQSETGSHLSPAAWCFRPTIRRWCAARAATRRAGRTKFKIFRHDFHPRLSLPAAWYFRPTTRRWRGGRAAT